MLCLVVLRFVVSRRIPPCRLAQCNTFWFQLWLSCGLLLFAIPGVKKIKKSWKGRFVSSNDSYFGSLVLIESLVANARTTKCKRVSLYLRLLYSQPLLLCRIHCSKISGYCGSFMPSLPLLVRTHSTAPSTIVRCVAQGQRFMGFAHIYTSSA